MPATDRSTMELGSRDFSMEDLARFRDLALSDARFDAPHSELLVLSGLSGVKQYEGLDRMGPKDRWDNKEPTYLYFTISWPSRARCSLYIDPDRPARIVIEGPKDWKVKVEERMMTTFGGGDSRYKVHSKAGYVIIWISVVSIAALFIAGYVLGSNESDPTIILPVMISSGLLGLYLSFSKMKDLQPANTISLKGRKRWWLESLMHLLVIALGIISAIMASFLVRFFLE